MKNNHVEEWGFTRYEAKWISNWEWNRQRISARKHLWYEVTPFRIVKYPFPNLPHIFVDASTTRFVTMKEAIEVMDYLIGKTIKLPKKYPTGKFGIGSKKASKSFKKVLKDEGWKLK